MTDLTSTIIAKSSQLNADDLLGGQTLTVKITDVKGVSGEQPIAISYAGDNNKPFMPCKTMRRLLVHVWGKNGKEYIGRSFTLYRDDSVTFGGLAVGGIRVSHMSHISAPITVVFAANKKSKKAITVHPLVVEVEPTASAELLAATEDAASIGTTRLEAHWKALSKPDQLLLKPHMEKMKVAAGEADKTSTEK